MLVSDNLASIRSINTSNQGINIVRGYVLEGDLAKEWLNFGVVNFIT